MDLGCNLEFTNTSYFSFDSRLARIVSGGEDRRSALCLGRSLEESGSFLDVAMESSVLYCRLLQNFKDHGSRQGFR